MSRERLLTVSARLFARGGFEATSMRDIAGEAGMLAGSMYYHFPSKNELIAAVYEAGVAEIGAAVDAAVARARAPWTRLEGACVAHLETLLADRAHAAVMTACAAASWCCAMATRRGSSNWSRRCPWPAAWTKPCGAFICWAPSTGRPPGIGPAASRRRPSRAPWWRRCASGL